MKTWIAEDSGDTASLAQALAVAPLFGLSASAAAVLAAVQAAVAGWQGVAAAIGMSTADIANYAPAFAHPAS